MVCKERSPTNLEVEVEEGVWAVTISSPSMTGAPTF